MSSNLNRLLFVSLVAMFELSLAPRIEAFGCRPNLIPNGLLNNCSNCHVDPRGGGPRNAFGSDVEEVAVGCDPFWSSALATLDSDGDGRTNGEELLDPEGSWTIGLPPPGDPLLVTNPGIPDEPPPPPGFVRGDPDRSETIDITDAIVILRVLFEGDASFACAAAADVNDDGRLNVADPVFIVGYLFSGTAAPPPPFPDCGPDPDGDDFGCDAPAC
ncbi:MAG TPA: hypothetical protein VK116_18830 [Planctomycetota bacterium]|nr:hypothetical protein [Planctomycetota bacterium]